MSNTKLFYRVLENIGDILYGSIKGSFFIPTTIRTTKYTSATRETLSDTSALIVTPYSGTGAPFHALVYTSLFGIDPSFGLQVFSVQAATNLLNGAFEYLRYTKQALENEEHRSTSGQSIEEINEEHRSTSGQSIEEIVIASEVQQTPLVQEHLTLKTEQPDLGDVPPPNGPRLIEMD